MIKKIIRQILFSSFVFVIASCKLVDNPIEPPPTVPTKDVRYVVTMTSSTVNSNPTITYTNSSGSITEIASLNLDVTVAIDSGTTAILSASCFGYYSASAGNSFAAVDIKLFVADSLAADSTDIQTNSFTTVSASASVSAAID